MRKLLIVLASFFSIHSSIADNSLPNKRMVTVNNNLASNIHLWAEYEELIDGDPCVTAPKIWRNCYFHNSAGYPLKRLKVHSFKLNKTFYFDVSRLPEDRHYLFDIKSENDKLIVDVQYHPCYGQVKVDT